LSRTRPGAKCSRFGAVATRDQIVRRALSSFSGDNREQSKLSGNILNIVDHTYFLKIKVILYSDLSRGREHCESMFGTSLMF